MTDELREAVEWARRQELPNPGYLLKLADFAEAHLGCSTITDQKVEAAAKKLAQFDRRLTEMHRVMARAALDAAARVGTEDVT